MHRFYLTVEEILHNRDPSMIINSQVPLHRLILSLSDALDYVHPNISNHKLRVAYISTNIARSIGFGKQELLDIFNAAALHDIGLIRVEKRILALNYEQLEEVAYHCEAGFELLRGNSLFSNVANMIRHHHTSWANGQAEQYAGNTAPIASNILHLADTVERAIDRNSPILEQSESITTHIIDLAGEEFEPDCVDAFWNIAQAEAFWLDCVSDRIYGVLLKQMDWPSLVLDETGIKPIADLVRLGNLAAACIAYGTK